MLLGGRVVMMVGMPVAVVTARDEAAGGEKDDEDAEEGNEEGADVEDDADVEDEANEKDEKLKALVVMVAGEEGLTKETLNVTIVATELTPEAGAGFSDEVAVTGRLVMVPTTDDTMLDVRKVDAPVDEATFVVSVIKGNTGRLDVKVEAKLLEETDVREESIAPKPACAAKPVVEVDDVV